MTFYYFLNVAAFFLKLEFILDEQSAMYYYQLLYQILQFLKII